VTSIDRKIVPWPSELSGIYDIVIAVVWNDTFVAVVALMVDVVGLGPQIVQRSRTTTVIIRHN